MAQPLFGTSALLTYWRSLAPGQFLLAAIATILIAGAYAAYRIHTATPDAIAVAPQPIGASENDAATATPAVPMAVESKPVEPERTAALLAPSPAADSEPPEPATARQRPAPVPATQRASAHQRPVPQRQLRVGAPRSMAHSLAAARVGAPAVQTRKALQRDPWQVMQVSLARCGGDLIARIVCNHRVHRRFCEGHWGEVPQCASGIANEHGQ